MQRKEVTIKVNTEHVKEKERGWPETAKRKIWFYIISEKLSQSSVLPVLLLGAEYEIGDW